MADDFDALLADYMTDLNGDGVPDGMVTTRGQARDPRMGRRLPPNVATYQPNEPPAGQRAGVADALGVVGGPMLGMIGRAASQAPRIGAGALGMAALTEPTAAGEPGQPTARENQGISPMDLAIMAGVGIPAFGAAAYGTYRGGQWLGNKLFGPPRGTGVAPIPPQPSPTAAQLAAERAAAEAARTARGQQSQNMLLQQMMGRPQPAMITQDRQAVSMALGNPSYSAQLPSGRTIDIAARAPDVRNAVRSQGQAGTKGTFGIGAIANDAIPGRRSPGLARAQYEATAPQRQQFTDDAASFADWNRQQATMPEAVEGFASRNATGSDNMLRSIPRGAVENDMASSIGLISQETGIPVPELLQLLAQRGYAVPANMAPPGYTAGSRYPFSKRVFQERPGMPLTEEQRALGNALQAQMKQPPVSRANRPPRQRTPRGTAGNRDF